MKEVYNYINYFRAMNILTFWSNIPNEEWRAIHRIIDEIREQYERLR